MVAFIIATKGVSSPDELVALFGPLGQKPKNNRSTAGVKEGRKAVKRSEHTRELTYPS